MPTQILLNNLIYDLFEIGLPFDTVRSEVIAQPQVWDMGSLLRFAGIPGLLSALFDFITVGALILIFKASPEEFRTIRFLDSMATQILVIFIISTDGRPWADLPRPILMATSLTALLVPMVLPFTPRGSWFGLVVSQPATLSAIGATALVCLVSGELLKPFALAAGACRFMRRQSG